MRRFLRNGAPVQAFVASCVVVCGARLLAAGPGIPVGDLLHAEPAAAAAEPVLAWIKLQGRPEARWATDLGDAALGPMPPMTEMELTDSVEALTGIDVLGRVAADGDSLDVEDDAAAAVGAAVARLRAQRLRRVNLDLTLMAGTETLLSARESVPTGVRRVIADAVDSARLSEYDVEIAQSAEIFDPVVRLLRTGASAEIRVLPLPGARAALVEVVVRVAAPGSAAPFTGGPPGMGPLDRAAVSVEEAAFTCRVEPGRPASHEWTGRDGRTLRSTVRVAWEIPAADDGSGCVVWTPLVERPPREFRRSPLAQWARHAEATAGREEDRPAHVGTAAAVPFDLASRLARAAAGGEPPKAVVAPAGFVVLSGKDSKTARDALCARIDADLREVPVALRVLDVPAGADVGSAVPAADAKELFRCSGRVVAGLSGSFAAGAERSYVADWDVEVAQGSQIEDPVVWAIEDGAFLDLRVGAERAGGRAAVAIDLRLVRLERFDAVACPQQPPRVSPAAFGTDDVQVDGPSAPRKRSTYSVELPVVRDLRIASEAELGADGTVVIRRSAASFLGPGREVVVVLSAR